MAASDIEYKFVVMGGGAVGKSSLTCMLCKSHFIEVYDPTIEDSYRTQFETEDGRVVVLDILDTAGQEDYSAMREQYMRSGQGFLIVYSITSHQSFEECATFRTQLNRTLDRDEFDSKPAPIVLVGNKCDLSDQRQVTQRESAEFASASGWKNIETSAKAHFNVEQAFRLLVKAVDECDELAGKPVRGKKKKAKAKKRCSVM
ncbi:Ras family GTPase [Pelomyxa schiedti]|nr:Ras family GTPase [Pelomyxa schiedti]